VRAINLRPADFVQARWEARDGIPAFFLVLCHARRTLVLCIRGTAELTDVVTDSHWM
jgi:hypothetical protein